MPAVEADAIADVADRLFEAIENSDIAMIQQLWNDDVVVWKVADRHHDKERALRVISWFINTTTIAATKSSTASFSIADSCSNTSCTPMVARRIDLDAGLHRYQVGRQRPHQPDRRILRPGRHRPAAGVDRFTAEVTWQASRILGNPASVGVWKVVPEQSTIGFKCMSMWGLVPVKGRFTEFSGDGQITDTQTVFGRIDIKADRWTPRSASATTTFAQRISSRSRSSPTSVWS